MLRELHLHTAPRTFERNRSLYAALVAAVVTTGLVWRSGLLPLSPFLAKYGGDSLWALMVFFCFGLVCPRSSTLRVALSTLCFAWSIEFLQLYHVPWIDAIRSTRPGHLVLGSSFHAADVFAYVIGIVLGVSAESACPSLLRTTRKVTPAR